MLRKSTARAGRGDDTTEYRTALADNVPRWRALNDLLYWASVAERRAWLAEKGERVTDDWRFSYMGHYWQFGPVDFARCLAWVRERPEHDNRLVAISRCLAIFFENDRPAAWRAELEAAAAAEPSLPTRSTRGSTPSPHPQIEEMEAKHRAWKRKRDAEEREAEAERAAWIADLKADPSASAIPAKAKPGEWSGDQYSLMLSVPGNSDTERGADWRGLIPKFGEAVAVAYRDAAVAFWRTYTPKLRSEGADTSGTPYILLFAMAGLAIEARETPDFAASLSPADARRALRYLTWELNGFPAWLEPLYKAHPDLGWQAIKQELVWELEHSSADAPTHHILHDLVTLRTGCTATLRASCSVGSPATTCPARRYRLYLQPPVERRGRGGGACRPSRSQAYGRGCCGAAPALVCVLDRPGIRTARSPRSTPSSPAWKAPDGLGVRSGLHRRPARRPRRRFDPDRRLSHPGIS